MASYRGILSFMCFKLKVKALWKLIFRISFFIHYNAILEIALIRKHKMLVIVSFLFVVVGSYNWLMQWIPSCMHVCHVFIGMALQSFACMFSMCVMALPSFPIPSCSDLFQASQADDELDEACSCYNLCQASQALG